MAIEMIAGASVKLGRTTYIIPPAPFACVEKYEDVFMGRDKTPRPTVIFDILFMSLLRNYPDLEREQLANDVDVKNMSVAFTTAMEVNAEGSNTGE